MLWVQIPFKDGEGLFLSLSPPTVVTALHVQFSPAKLDQVREAFSNEDSGFYWPAHVLH